MPPVDLLSLLLPALLVTTGGLAALGTEPFIANADKHRWLPWIAALSLFAALVAQIGLLHAGAYGQLDHIFAIDPARAWLCAAVIGSTLIALAGLQQSLARDHYTGGEPYALMLFSAVGALLMVMANDTLALFVGLEIASISVYALVGLRRDRKESNEALFKYFVMGAVFSAVFLYGAALTYGATGSTHFGTPVLAGRDSLMHLGQLLIIVGLLFKVGAVPFHFWSPDAYTGAPAAITGYMGAVIKIGGFTALGAVWLNLINVIGGDAQAGTVLALDASIQIKPLALGGWMHQFTLIFIFVGILSVLLGNFSALKQTSARRLIAFSSVAHAGYMLLAFALPGQDEAYQLGGLWFYLVGYGLATAGTMSAIAAMAGPQDANDSLTGLAGQGRASPLNGLVLTVFIASFAGIPPTAGFLGKFLIFGDLVGKGYVAVAIAAMILAVVGAAYYLRLLIWVWAVPAKEPARTGPTAMGAWALSAAAIAVVVLVGFPGGVYHPERAVADAPAPAPMVSILNPVAAAPVVTPAPMVTPAVATPAPSTP
jgi:NADH-quinone oxidoreductase subunit N